MACRSRSLSRPSRARACAATPARVTPLDEWLAAGASLAAGTDIARPFNPMTNVWGMVTRGTKAAGVQGPEHKISVATVPSRKRPGPGCAGHAAEQRSRHACPSRSR
jgi:hypothetical protein